MNRTPFRLCIFAFLSVLMACAEGAAEDIDPRLEKVLADWQKRQNAFPTVRYEVRGERRIPRGAYNILARAGVTRKLPPGQDVPSEDTIAALSLTLLLDFENGRHRREMQEPTYLLGARKLIPRVKRDSFDGSVAKRAMPRQENPTLGKTTPELTIVSGNMKNNEFLCNYFPIFFGHGRIYTVMEPIIPGKLRNKPDPDYLYVHGSGIHEGRTCLIVRTQTLKRNTTSFDEYWIDTGRESAILRQVSYCNSKPAHDITIQYRKYSTSWLPEGWRLNIYGENLVFSDKMHVENVALDPAINDADFQMEIKPGMIVEERTDLPTKHPLVTPESKISVYRAKEEGGRETLPDPYRRKDDQNQDQLRRKDLWIWACLALPVLAAGGFLVWARRRRRTS